MSSCLGLQKEIFSWEMFFSPIGPRHGVQLGDAVFSIGPRHGVPHSFCGAVAAVRCLISALAGLLKRSPFCHHLKHVAFATPK